MKHIKKLKENPIEKMIILVQVSLYLSSISLTYIDEENAGISPVILRFSLMCSSILIKILRELWKKNWKILIKNQISFYLAYMLMVFEIVFLYQSMYSIFPSYLTNWSIALVVADTVVYSLIMNQKTANYFQLFVYSIALIVKVAEDIKGNIVAVQKFDSGEFDGIDQIDYIKDMVLLFIATAIALSILILDLMFRVYEKIQEKKQQKKKQQKLSTQRSMNVELLKMPNDEISVR